MSHSKTSLTTTNKDDGSCAMSLSITLAVNAENLQQTRKALFNLLAGIMADLDAGRL